MMRFGRGYLWLLLLCTGTGALADAVDDRFDRVDRECFERMPATFSECEAYVAEMAGRVETNDDAALLHSVGLSRLANFTDDPELASERSERARAGLNEYLARHPNDVSALFELVSLVDTDEQTELLKRIVGIDRSNTVALQILVRALSNTDDEENHILALRYLEQGYQETTGANRLTFGSWMFEAMVANGRRANAVQIQQRIANDFNFSSIDWDAVPTDQDISQFCQHGFLVVQLEETCINLIYSAAVGSNKAGQAYSTTMLEAIELLLSSRESLGAKFPEYAFSMRDVLEEHPNDAARSGYYYLVYSLVVTRDRKIAALRSALEQGDYYEPRIRHWLGVALRDLGEFEQARAELEKVMQGDDPELAQLAGFELTVLEEMQGGRIQ